MTEIPWGEVDPAIVPALHALADYGTDTFSSCSGGGPPHACDMPEILFHGGPDEGLRAVWLLEGQGFRVQWLARVWDLDHGLPWQPYLAGDAAYAGAGHHPRAGGAVSGCWRSWYRLTLAGMVRPRHCAFPRVRAGRRPGG